MGLSISFYIISLYSSSRGCFNASVAIVSETMYTFLQYKISSIKDKYNLKSKQTHICHIKGHKRTVLRSTRIVKVCTVALFNLGKFYLFSIANILFILLFINSNSDSHGYSGKQTLAMTRKEYYF